MRFSPSALARAVSAHVSQELGERMLGGPSDELAAFEAGGLVLRALLRRDPGEVLDLPLIGVRLDVEGDSIELEPEDAFRHPLLRDCLSGDFAEALGEVLWNGACHGFVRGDAAIQSLNVTHGVGPDGVEAAGTVIMALQGATASIYYGEASATAGLRELSIVDPAALMSAGYAAARLGSAAEPEADRPTVPPASAFPFTRH